MTPPLSNLIYVNAGLSRSFLSASPAYCSTEDSARHAAHNNHNIESVAAVLLIGSNAFTMLFPITGTLPSIEQKPRTTDEGWEPKRNYHGVTHNIEYKLGVSARSLSIGPTYLSFMLISREQIHTVEIDGVSKIQVTQICLISSTRTECVEANSDTDL